MSDKVKQYATRASIAGAAVMLASPAAAFATAPTVDYADASNGIMDQISAALPAALTVFGIVLGITFGIRFFKKIVSKG